MSLWILCVLAALAVGLVLRYVTNKIDSPYRVVKSLDFGGK